jgi:predicted glycosyltransferase
MKRLAFYCQHLLGIGHLTRSLALCKSLCEKFEVDFIQGGEDIGLVLDHTNLNRIQIPPLLMNESDSKLFVPNAERSLEEQWLLRRDHLRKIADTKYDVIITELYPFGRKKFRDEILGFLDQVKKMNPQVFVATSVRDILVEKPDQSGYDQKILEIVNKYYDSILVHADPEVVKLEETYSLATRLKEKIYYTGYVCESVPPRLLNLRKKQILVSSGGGVVGIDLLLACIDAAKEIIDYKWLITLGPYLSLSDQDLLKEKSRNSKNIELVPFLKNFEIVLSESELSISLAGYNTLMNVLNTRTRALVFPYKANREQTLRSEKLKERGLVEIVEAEDLKNLAAMVKTILETKYPETNLNLNGAEVSALKLAEVVS